MIRRLLSRPFAALLASLLAITPAAAYARPGEGQPFGIDWTPIVFWAIVGGVITLFFVLGLLIDWGNR
jgi:hypothetical protein